MTKQIEIFIEPYLEPSQEKNLPPLINQLLTSLNKLQSEQIRNSFQNSWKILIKQDKDLSETHIYTPVEGLLNFIKKINDLPQNPVTKPQFENLFEETKTISLRNICKIQVSWDGIIKISTYDKNAQNNFFINSTNQVIIDHLYANNLTITSPYATIRSFNQSNYLTFSNDQAKMPILEINPESYLYSYNLEIHGLLLNKGTLDLFSECKITAISLSNLGNLKGYYNLKINTQSFNNYGRIESRTLTIKTNTFYQIPIDANIYSSIKSDHFSIETSEEVKIKAGYIKAKEFKLTSLGLFENDVNILAESINFNIQSTFLNRGNYNANSVQINAYDSVYNTGKINAKDEIKIFLNNNNCIFYQEGKIDTNRLEINAALKNSGYISSKQFFWNGKYKLSENYGEINISDEAHVDVFIIDQKGKLFVKNMKGRIYILNNYSISCISSDEEMESLLINNLQTFGESRFNLLGSLEVDHFINKSLCFIKGFLYTSICTNEEEGKIVFEEYEKPKTYPDFILTNSKKSGIFLYKLKKEDNIFPFKFVNKGKIISKYGLWLSDFNYLENGAFLIEGDLTITNERLYTKQHVANYPLKETCVIGNITIIDPKLTLTIDNEINIENCLKFKVNNYIQKAKVRAKNIEIDSQKASIDDDLYSEENLTIHSKELINNSDIQSSKSLILELDRFNNNGEIGTDSLDFNGRRVENKGKIVCFNGKKFRIESNLVTSNTSIILLNNQNIELPSKMEFNGIFEANFSSIKSNVILSCYYNYVISSNAKLVLKNSCFHCLALKNYGEFEINDSKVHGKGIYTTYDRSITSFYGNSSLSALTLDLHGITKSDRSIRITFGNNPSYIGGFENNINLTLQNPPNCTKNNFVSNFVDIVNGSVPKCKYISEDQIILKGSFYSISNSGSDKSLYEVTIIAPCLKLSFANIKSAKKIEIITDTFNNFDSNIQSKKLRIHSREIHNKSGFIYSLSSLEIEATSLTNTSGQIGAEDYVQIKVKNDLINDSLIFSKSNYLKIKSHNIDNSYATIYSKGSINIYCKNILINSGGLLLSLDPEMTSTIQTSHLFNSIFYKEYVTSETNLLRIIMQKNKETVTYPGEIIIAGNCKLTGDVNNNGSHIYIGKTLFNEEFEHLSFESNEIDNNRGYIIANKACLFVEKFKSNGCKSLFGPGGLKIESKSSISFNDSYYSYICSGKPINLHNIACLYPFLFSKCDNGVIDVCLPLRKSGINSTWNSNEELNQTKKSLFMMTPDALKLAFSLLPIQIHSEWETNIESLICNQQEEIKSNNILSVEQAKKLNKLSISWITESNDNKLYPVVVLPNKHIESDVYSEGLIDIYSKSSIILNNVNVFGKDKVNLESSKLVEQNGGIVYSGDKLSIKSKEIHHEPCNRINNEFAYWFSNGKRGYDTFHPCVKANEFYENGNVHGKAIQCKAKKYNHEGGTLKIEADLVTKVTYQSSEKDNIKSQIKRTTQVVIPSRIMAEEAHFHCSSELKGAIAYIKDIYKYSDLSIKSQVVTDTYECKAKKSGFFSRSTMESTGGDQKSFPSYVKGNNLIDMTDDVNKGLLMRSSILDVVNAELKSNIKQETDFLKHYNHTNVKKVGITLPWFDDPRPSLFQSIDSLIHASNVADGTVSGIQTVTNSLRLVNDAAHVALEGGPYVPNILKNFASKIATFSIGVTEENHSNTHYQPVPNEIRCENLKIRNEKTEIRGSIKSKKIDIKTEDLLVEAPISTGRNTVEVENKSISISPLQAKITNPAGLLPTVSWSNSTNEIRSKKVTKVEVEAEEIKIKADYMHVNGAKVSADKLDAKIKKDLIVESIEDEIVEVGDDTSFSISLGGFGSALKSATSAAASTGLDAAMKTINKTPLSLAPTIRFSDHKNVDKGVNIEASLIGKKECNINVGSRIIKKSANVGKMTNGKVTDEGVFAPMIIDEKIKRIKTNKSSTFVAPIGDAIALLGAANELAQIRHVFFKALQNKEKDDKRALEKLNSKEIQEIIQIMIDFLKEDEKEDEINEHKSVENAQNTKLENTQNNKSNDKKVTNKNQLQKSDKNTKINKSDNIQNNKSNDKKVTNKNQLTKSDKNTKISKSDNTQSRELNDKKATNKNQLQKDEKANQPKSHQISFKDSQQDEAQTSENNQQNKSSDDHLDELDLKNPDDIIRFKKMISERLMQKNGETDPNHANKIENLVSELFNITTPDILVTPCSYKYDDNRKEPLDAKEKEKEERIEKIFRGAVKEYYDNLPGYQKEEIFEFYRRKRLVFKKYLPSLYEVYDSLFPRYSKVFFKSLLGRINRFKLPPEIKFESIEQLKQRHCQFHRYLYEYIDRKIQDENYLTEILDDESIPLQRKNEIIKNYKKNIEERNEREKKEYESLGFKLELTNQVNYEVNDAGPIRRLRYKDILNSEFG